MNYRKEYRRLFSLTPNEVAQEFDKEEDFFKKLTEYMNLSYQELMKELEAYELLEPMGRR